MVGFVSFHLSCHTEPAFVGVYDGGIFDAQIVFAAKIYET